MLQLHWAQLISLKLNDYRSNRRLWMQWKCMTENCGQFKCENCLFLAQLFISETALVLVVYFLTVKQHWWPIFNRVTCCCSVTKKKYHYPYSQNNLILKPKLSTPVTVTVKVWASGRCWCLLPAGPSRLECVHLTATTLPPEPPSLLHTAPPHPAYLALQILNYNHQLSIYSSFDKYLQCCTHVGLVCSCYCSLFTYIDPLKTHSMQIKLSIGRRGTYLHNIGNTFIGSPQ